MKNNLFKWATSELSQDAFLCWLLSFAKNEHENEDRTLSKCAKDLLKLMIPDCEKIQVTSIKRQYENIDVLVVVNDIYNIIIEDKTFTSEHGNQINRYKETLIKEGREDIICVYLKIVEQSYEEESADINITRKDLLKIFTKYSNEITNAIFLDYLSYLISIDSDVNSYKVAPINEWRKKFNHAYKGFFTHLIEEKYVNISRGYGWKYVSNPKGGFWGLWWDWLSEEELHNANLSKEFVDGLYLQIEDNIIAVKLSTLEVGLESTKSARYQLYNYFKEKINQNGNVEFYKKNFRQGRYMTVGYIEYNENNYAEKIKLMENIMESVANGEFKFDAN